MQVVWLHPAFDEGAHELAERRDIIVDAPQKHRLAHHRDACIDQPRAGRPRRRRQFARMVGVRMTIGRTARRLEGRDQRRIDALGIDRPARGCAAHYLDVLDIGERA